MTHVAWHTLLVVTVAHRLLQVPIIPFLHPVFARNKWYFAASGKGSREQRTRH